MRSKFKLQLSIIICSVVAEHTHPLLSEKIQQIAASPDFHVFLTSSKSEGCFSLLTTTRDCSPHKQVVLPLQVGTKLGLSSFPPLLSSVDALSAMIQPSPDELRFVWNLPHDLYYLLFSFLKIDRIWDKVLGSGLYSRTDDATNVTLPVTVCASPRLWSPSSTKLHLAITFGVCCRAVSPPSAVRRLNFAPSVPYHKAPGWQASCDVCIRLPQCTTSRLHPPQDHSLIFRCLSCAPSWMGEWRLQWGPAAQRGMEQHKPPTVTPRPHSMCSSLPPYGTPSQDEACLLPQLHHLLLAALAAKISPDPQAQRVEGRGCFFSSAHIVWIQMVSPQGGKPSHPKPKFYSRNCFIHYMYHFNLVPSCFEGLHLLTTLSIGFLTYLCSSLLCHPRNKFCCFSSSV